MRDAPPCLELLGGFRMTIGGEEVELPIRSQRLIALLGINDRPLSRELVAGTLWPDMTEERAGANLRESLWRLRTACNGFIQTRNQHLVLSPQVRIDFRHMVDQATRLVISGVRDEEDLRLERLTRDLLPSWYDEWVVMERESARQLRLHALEAACERLIALGRHAEAVLAGARAVTADPMRESAHRALIRAHLAEGNASEAAVQYGRCRTLLEQELRIAPSAQLEELVADIRPQGPGRRHPGTRRP